MNVHSKPGFGVLADGRSLADLIREFAASAETTNTNLSADGLVRLRTWIGSKKLRYFVYNAKGFGNQANSVNLMKRMLQLGFTNDIELIYDTSGQEAMTVLQKLAVLLPGLNPDNPQPYQLGPNTVITFFAYSENGGRKVDGLQGQLPLCINGGSEMKKEADPNLADVFKVDFYLQVQPYMWEVANQVDNPRSLILPKGADASIILPQQESLQGALYTYRAFAMAQPPVPDWAQLLSIPANLTNRNSIAVAKILSEAATAKKITMAPVYGLYDETFGNPVIGTATSIAFQYITGNALAQSQGTVGNAPVVIMVLSNLKETTWQRISSFYPLAGEKPVKPAPPPSESESSDESGGEDDFGFGFFSYEEEFDETLFDVQSWCYQTGLVQPNEKTGQKGRVHIAQTMEPDDLTKLLATLTGNDILVIGAPLMPQDAFNYLYSIAGIPSLFEGQGTANLALNLGKPFFKLNTQKVKSYPSAFGNGSDERAAVISAKAAELEKLTYDNIQLGYYDFDTGSKNGSVVEALAGVIGRMTQGTDGFGTYFSEIEQFYGTSANDKLLQALVFLVTTLVEDVGGQEHALRLLAAAALKEGDTPLDKLYEQIENAISKGVLALIPTVIPNGPFAEFLTAVIEGTDFNIGSPTSPVEVNYPASRDKITVTGRTQDFLGIPLETSVIFMMNANGKDIDTAFALSVGEVSLAGVQWFKLDSLKVDATIPGNDNRMHGTISSKIEIGGNPVSFDLAFPSSADGKVVIDGDFSTNPPSLDDLFKLLGGLNFMTTLPPQISSVANIELRKLKFGYDFKASRINSFQLTLENNKPWPLFGKLELSNLAFNIGLVEPTGARRITWQASTNVVIGADGGSVDVTVSYPNLTVTAGLKEGGPPIPVGDLVTFFLPDNYTINLAAVVSAFDMAVTPGEKGAATIYKVSGGLTMDADVWKLSLGIASFALTDVFLIVEGQQGETKKQTVVTGALTANTQLDFKSDTGTDLAVPFSITAAYREKGVWFFSGKQGDQPIRVKQIIEAYLGDTWWVAGLPNLDITDLAFSIQTPEKGADPSKATSYMVGGSIRVWNTPLGDSFETVITGRFGQGQVDQTARMFARMGSRALVPVLNDAGAIVPLMGAARNSDRLATQDGKYGVVTADILWNNIELQLYFNYAPDKRLYGFYWGILHGEIDSSTDTATMTFTEGTTLGAMVETFISWLTGSKFGLGAPWNLLNKIKLSNFKLIWNFKNNTVQFEIEIGPIDLIFARIDSFGIKYEPTGENKGVNVTLKGSFPWMKFVSAEEAGKNSTDKLGWNAANPSETPAPPGGGNKYLDLRLLAAGQHIKVDGLQQATSVPKAIEILGQLPVPKDGEPPAVGFDATNNWMFGTDFGILKVESTQKSDNTLTVLVTEESGAKYTFTLQIVFTDPTLYALRIALDKDAPAAKIFAGLDFQIMYRKLSEGLGVFSAEIVLPTIMRRIDVGAVTITLPTFGVEIYTNGDFKFDIGFPWNEDFSRSFSVEAIIPPGIPVLGSGGFYFGKLPAVAVDQLPKAKNGFFNPNIVFGFGAQMGLGKSIDYGILKAGFSITVFGIIEGIFAKWNPYDKVSTGGGGALALSGEYFFWLRGTFGVLGHIYGTVDFVVVKASVDVRLKVYVQITLASYEPIPVTVSAEVTASASVTINLGLFKIHLSFSFALKITETFEIGYLQNPDDAPWQVEKSNDGGRLLAPFAERLNMRSHNVFNTAGLRLLGTTVPDWSRLEARPEGDLSPLTAYAGFGVTVAGDRAFTGTGKPDTSRQFPAYIASLFIEGPGAAKEGDHTNMLRAAGEAADTSFDLLAKMVARWAIASIQSSNVTVDEVDATQVNDLNIAGLIEALSNSTSNPMPITSADVEAFLGGQFKMTVSLPTEDGTAQAAYFPMPMGLGVKAPQIGTQPALDYAFGDYNAVDPDFISWLRTYFDQLAVQVQQEENPVEEAVVLGSADVSVANFIQGDYFVLVMRQMLQAMREGLRDFKYPLNTDAKPNDIVDWVNTTGELDKLGQPFSLYDLFKGNETSDLSEGKALQLPFVQVTVSDGDSFTSLAEGQSYSAIDLATGNASVAGILVAGVAISYKGDTYVTSGSETLSKLALRMKATVAEMLAGTDILTRGDLLLPLSALTLPPHAYTTKSKETLSGVAAAHGLTVQDLAGVARGEVQNPVGTENGDVAGLFEAGADTVLDLVYLPQFPVSVLLAEAQRTGAISHLSGMSSRYYLHGLRLPTAKITPKQQGMWVTDDNGTLTLPDFAGLYALTGQQIGVEALPNDPLALTLTDPGTVPWMSFADGAAELSFEITPPDDKLPDGDENYQRLKAIDTYCRKTVLAAGPKSISASAKAGQEPARYPLSSSILWQSLAQVPFPNGPVLENAVPRIWPLPASMVSLSSLGTDQSGLLDQPSPAFTLQTVTTDVATGLPVDADMQVFGWASSIRFVVKKLPAGAQASAAQKDTYEITGASAEDTVILERIVQYVTQDSAFASLAVGFQTASESTGEVLRAEVGPDVSFGISQSNLSTTTRPPVGAAAEAVVAPAPANLLNKPTDLIRLLWEASITRNGGFFLYYYDDASAEGLPDEAFNDKGEAELNLIVQYQPDIRLQPWMNAVATGDPIDTSATNVVAKTESTLLDHTVAADESLDGIVRRYNSTLVSLLETTPAAIGLTAGAVLKLTNAVYQVADDGSAPGGNLSQIAIHFAMDPQDIEEANPRIPAAYWTDGLPPGTAIRLPDVNRTVGTSPGGTTLQAIAAYYGTSTLALAGANAAVPGLPASAGQVSLMTGPLAQHGSQAPGTQPVKALRDGLPEVPDDPKDPDFAPDYLLNDFTLLAYRVVANADFEMSNLGLPLSQQGKTTRTTDDKIRFARAMTPKDDLVYETSVPYVDLAKSRPAGDNPYDANGRLLQLEFGWNDVFGNKMVSDVDKTATAAGKLNGRASLTGYTDLVLGVAQWPSISTHWTVGDTDPAGDEFVITVEASFDPQPYLPDLNDKSEGWKAKARAGLQTVTAILNQIADPSGLRFSIETTLLPEPVTVPEAQILPASDVSTLAAWLTAIQSFLAGQAGPDPVDKFDGKAVFAMTVQDNKSKVPASEVFELGLDLILTRTTGVAEGDFAAIPGVRTARSAIAPLADVGSAVDGNPGDGNVLASFAEALRATLSVPGKNTLMVATGTDRYAAGAGVTQAAIWAVRLGQDGSDTGIGFTVADPSKPEIYAPEPVSNTLITRTVDIFPYTALEDYDPATDTFTTKPAAKAFSGVDADSWVKEFFAFFDTILSPEYSSSILVVDARAGNKPVHVDSFLTALADQKEKLAGVASNLMAEVYQGQPGTRLASAREALRQSLLERLSNLYTTRAAVSFGAEVSARIPQDPNEKTPQLYGNLQWVTDPQKLASLVTLTSPKMPLADGDNQPITFLLQAPQVLKVDGTVVDEIDLDLRYAGAALEHQIAAVPGVEGNYYASSWLSPVDKAFAPLAGELGAFTVPILLRGFPSTPRMEVQTGAPTHPAAEKLSDLTQWSYGLTYSLDFHYPQDRVYATVLYNVKDNGAALLAALTDAFQGLAQFVTSQSAVVELINANVPQISAATTDQKKIDDASLALGAFLKMASDITTQAVGVVQADEGGRPGSLKMVSGKRALSSSGSYAFYVEENTRTFRFDGGDVTAWVVTMTSTDGVPPPELNGDPEIRIEGYRQVQVPALSDAAKGIYAYAYQYGEDVWAQGSDLQGIAARNILLPGLQILDQQDAISVVHLTQNEDVGGKINLPFVYQTPSVSFGNPFHPTISTSQPVDIATLGSPGGGQVRRSLDAQLTALFTALFESGFEGVTTIQFDVAYSFAFTSGLDGMAVTIPVAVLPPMQVSVPGTKDNNTETPPIANMIATLSAAIQDWSQAYAPSRQDGQLSFNLTIMSNLTMEPMPLLNLMKLELNVDDIVPPLPNLS